MLELDWKRLVEQIRKGECTPFLGAGACVGTLPLGAELSHRWAESYHYPLNDKGNLLEVMQYVTLAEKDPVTVKERVADELLGRGNPNFGVPTQPHALLARHPIRVFLTTNYDGFMTLALRGNHKDPVTRICPWYLGAETDDKSRLPEGYQPDERHPLVYHLHGALTLPSSLVLTERDYVEFLVNLARDQGQQPPRVVPPPVLEALTRHPLLFIGYSLRDWSFRVLFESLVQTIAGVQRRRHVSVQLVPGGDEDGEVVRYLDEYFDKQNISVYWGPIEDFCQELHDRLEAA